jgi:hypothetical protein
MPEKFTAKHHKLADLDQRNAMATNEAQTKAGLPRFHFKFDVNGLGQPGGSYKVTGVDETGPGSVTGSLASHIASNLPAPREFKAIGVCADCGKRVRKSTAGGQAQVVHISDGATAAGEHPARVLGDAEGRNRALSSQFNPSAFDENGIMIPEAERQRRVNGGN